MFGHLLVPVFVCCVFSVPFVSSLAYYTAVKSQLDQTVFLYPGQARSDVGLDFCTNGGVCSIVHQVYWFPPRAERLCQCPGRQDCPFTWTKHDDNRTLFLNNLSQMKTCNRTDEMPVCKPGQTALLVEETQTEALKEQKVLATAFCTCKTPTYWTLQKHFLEKFTNGTTHTTSYYQCTDLTKCKVDEHCANVRQDYYSTYQHCYCPKGHMCLAKEKSETNVTELLFSGPALRSYCSPFKTTEHTKIQDEKIVRSDNAL